MPLLIDFCGEQHSLELEDSFTIGREADLVVDDNPYLHRRFLQFVSSDDLWFIVNVGSQLSATVSDRDGRVQAWLAPGARLPIVFEETTVRFTAGPTSYEVDLFLEDAVFAEPVSLNNVVGDTTIGLPRMTRDQKLLVLALSEPVLRSESRGTSSVPSSAQAAARLGWTMTKFNRKLDNVSQKLTKIGVRGLHGEPGALASNRRARLVEYAVAVRLVTVEDLPLLDQQSDLPQDA